MLTGYKTDNKHAIRTPRKVLFALGMAILLLVAAAPPAAAETTTLPPLGMSMGSVSALKAAGAPPMYGSYWVGDWMADSGWGGFDSAMKTAKTAGVTPVVYWYYWGDSISPSCFDADGCNGRTETEWYALTDQLVSHLKTTLGGSEALVVLENEFNKGGITGTFAPTFDAKLEKVAIKLNAVAGVKLIVGFGNWGESNWGQFPKTIAASEYVGYQMMRASTKDTEASYRSAADRSAYLANFIAEKFNKPSFLYDVALSSYPDASWEKVQAETLDAIFAKLQTSGTTGLQGIVYRSLNDHYMSPANYYGYAESHWGLRTKDGVAKPAFDVWLKHATGTAAPAPAPAAPNVPGSFEGESMTATKGGLKTDASASGGAAWNLWANGQMTTTLVTDSARAVEIRVVAQGQLAAGVEPRMEVRLAGQTIASFDVAGGSYASYEIAATLPAGSTALAIAFTNDEMVNGEDRNLIVDVVRVTEPAPAPVNQPPAASFVAIVEGLSASFDASASSDPEGAALSYAFAFGDGNTGSGAQATHTYAAPGTYTVTLTVNDGVESASTTREITPTQPNRAPLAALSASVVDLVASFDASGSSDPDGDALVYAYDFGDGTGGSGRTASHAYAASGTYRVTLGVSDGEFTSLAKVDVTVIQPNRAPVAHATVSGANDTYAFDVSGSSDADGDAITYEWSFGDGARATGARVSHTYASAGSYAVTLTVTDARGLSGTSSVGVKAAKPFVPFAASFSNVKGNNYWVQTSLSTNKAISSVCASVDGGSCKTLALKSWGDYAASFYVPNNAKVVLKATATSGEIVSSGAYLWPTATPVVEPTATFTPYDGNAHWVQTKVSASKSVKSVCATLNGGACKALAYKSWDAWAASYKAPPGTKVVFYATLSDGSVVKSSTYTWPVK